MEALGQHWEQQCREGKLSPATVQNQMSIFRRFSAWIGKDGMVEGSNKYVSPECCGRTSINTIDRSWAAQGVDVEAKIAEIAQMDSRVRLQLELSMAFGLRAREAMQLCPHVADKGTYLEVTKGTKGGRPRVVQIKTPEQRVLLDRAKAFASSKTGSTSDPTKRLAQVKNHSYYVLRRCGVSRKAGFTQHGLRHGYANQRYKALSGQDSPVQGGNMANKEDDAVARKQVAEELGHSRTDITNHYLGKDKGEG
jgi:integrase